MRAPSSLSHYGNYDCDYLPKIAPVFVSFIHTKSTVSMLTFADVLNQIINWH